MHEAVAETLTKRELAAMAPKWLLIVIVLVYAAGGCTRSRYTELADEDAYHLVRSRLTDARWCVPTRAIEPPTGSRMQLTHDLDCAPRPPDDPAAEPLMFCPDGHRNDHYWLKIPQVKDIECPQWLTHLPRDQQGEILLSQPLAMDLALLHSRDYQTRYEAVYLTGLQLTGNQFEFATQWFGGVGTQYTATGEDLANDRLLQVTDRLGFGRRLAGGGQFATNILNSFFWDFGPNGSSGASGQIVSTFTQPLLRGAFRHVRLENLTQAERNLMYEVREFARFRRLFYLDVSSSYLRLLSQVQSIRNAEANLESLRLNLVEHQELLSLKMVAQIQVDQVFQDYQNGRLSLLAAQQGLASSLDQFKFLLGLPAWTPLKIDESMLQPFTLQDYRLIELEQQTQGLYLSLLQYLPPQFADRQVLLDAFDKYRLLHSEVLKVFPEILDEFKQLKGQIEQARANVNNEDDKFDLEQQHSLVARIEGRMQELQTTFDRRDESDDKLLGRIQAYDPKGGAKNVVPAPGQGDSTAIAEKSDAELTWEAIRQAIGRDLREEIAELTIAQTQIRLFLISVEAVQVDERAAINFAQHNRLDQMNRLAQVTDAFRKIEVAADLLQSELNVSGQVALGTDPSKDNAFRFDSSANSYRVGVQFDGPLNRLNERNIYRASQIAYQQSAREFVSGKDRIANEVRSALRDLNLRRLNFQISRQQLVAATRQVDEAQIALRTATQSSTNLTRDLLQALQGQLNAKNNLISNWIDTKIAKIRLYVFMELLYLDDNGVWFNESDSLNGLAGMVFSEDYFPPPELGLSVHSSSTVAVGGGQETPSSTNASDSANHEDLKTGMDATVGEYPTIRIAQPLQQGPFDESGVTGTNFFSPNRSPIGVVESR